jgi:hypothetical protein
LGGSSFRHIQHGLAEVEAHGVGSGLGQFESDIARSAANVQSVIPRLEGGRCHHLMFPEPVHPEALEVVDDIVTGSDGGK